MNAKEELLFHVEGMSVEYIHIKTDTLDIKGTLEECLPSLDFEYHDGFGCQELFGFVWYSDGTWSSRGEYDGSEWWEHNMCPPRDVMEGSKGTF